MMTKTPRKSSFLRDPFAIVAILNLLVLCSYALAADLLRQLPFLTFMLLLQLWFVALLAALILLILGLVFRTRRWLILGLLNGVAALGETGFVVFVATHLAP